MKRWEKEALINKFHYLGSLMDCGDHFIMMTVADIDAVEALEAVDDTNGVFRQLSSDGRSDLAVCSLLPLLVVSS